MFQTIRKWISHLAAVMVFVFSTSAGVADSHTGNEIERVEFEDARLKIEMNATDGDAGIHVFIDVDEWKWVAVYDTRGRQILRSVVRGRLARQGGTELFLESAEPDFSELPLDEFLERFPEGTYHFRGRNLDGDIIVGSAEFTHNIPDGPVLVYPLESDGPVDPNNTILLWQAVGPVNGSPIVGYQVLVVHEESDIPAIPKVALDVIMPASATSLQVPAGFLLPDTEYEWEVLAIESGGNQTLSAAFFTTTP